MRLYDVVLLEGWFRRKIWDEGKHVRFYGSDEINAAQDILKQPMRMHKHADSVITWPWAPTPLDIVADDWEPYGTR